MESDNIPSRPTRFINQSQIFEGQPIKISDQLSNYDDTSPNEDHSKVATNHSTIDFSKANGSAQSPVVAVPVKVKENILKVCMHVYLHIVTAVELLNSYCIPSIWAFGVHHYEKSIRYVRR